MRALAFGVAALLLASPSPPGVLAQVDHLVLATPDLQLGIDTAERLFGVRATPGGRRFGIDDRLVPYFIGWGSSPHPSATAAGGVTLVSLRAEHPDVGRVHRC